MSRHYNTTVTSESSIIIVLLTTVGDNIYDEANDVGFILHQCHMYAFGGEVAVRNCTLLSGLCVDFFRHACDLLKYHALVQDIMCQTVISRHP